MLGTRSPPSRSEMSRTGDEPLTQRRQQLRILSMRERSRISFPSLRERSHTTERTPEENASNTSRLPVIDARDGHGHVGVACARHAELHA